MIIMQLKFNTFNIASYKILLNNLLKVLILINISPSYCKNGFRVGIVAFQSSMYLSTILILIVKMNWLRRLLILLIDYL